MIKTVATFALCFTLAACGGGGDNNTNDQAIPTGAKVCELKEISVSRFATYSNGEIVWDVGNQPSSTLARSDGRHQIWFWPGPTWVSIDASTYTLNPGSATRWGTTPIEGIVAFDGMITLAGDLSYGVTYASILGLKDGIPLIGTRHSIPRFGVVGAVEREPRSDDVTGFRAESRFVSLPEPAVTVMWDKVLQVNKSIGIGRGPTPDDVKLDLFILEDCYHCGKTTTWSCQIRDLNHGDIVAITGAPQGMRFFANLYMTTRLDDGQKAVSEPTSVSLAF